MKKILLISSLLVAFLNNANAQMAYSPLGIYKFDKTENLFDTDDFDLNIYYQTTLGNGVSLQFAFSNVSLWQGEEEFKRPLNTAIEQLKLYTDLLKPFANTRRLDIFVNEKNDAISRLRSFEKHNDVRIVKNDQLEALKMDSDTLRIVSAYNSKMMQGLLRKQRFQYTFVMKDLKDFSAVLKDEKWIANTAHIIDSVMAVHQEKWRKPDASFHTLSMKYKAGDTIKPISIRKRDVDEYNWMGGLLIVNGGFGISLVRNTLCPNADIGAQFYFAGPKDQATFVRLSFNSFTRFVEQPDQKFRSLITSFANAEFGLETLGGSSYKNYSLFSMGFGYKLTGKQQLFQDPSMDKNMYKLFFKYGLTRNIILQTDFITNFKQKEKQNGWIGITANFLLF